MTHPITNVTLQVSTVEDQVLPFTILCICCYVFGVIIASLLVLYHFNISFPVLSEHFG